MVLNTILCFSRKEAFTRPKKFRMYSVEALSDTMICMTLLIFSLIIQRKAHPLNPYKILKDWMIIPSSHQFCAG